MKEYSQTAAVWFRGLLQDEYGVDWRDIHWFVPRRQRFPAPAEAGVGTLDGNLEQLVLDGELDAYVSTRATLPGLRPVLRAHADASAAYLARTGIFPINHTVVIDRALIDGHPTLPSVVFDAYCAARGKAGDPHRFGFAGSNRMIVETVFRYLHEQRLTERLQRVDDLFILRDTADTD